MFGGEVEFLLFGVEGVGWIGEFDEQQVDGGGVVVFDDFFVVEKDFVDCVCDVFDWELFVDCVDEFVEGVVDVDDVLVFDYDVVK